VAELGPGEVWWAELDPEEAASSPAGERLVGQAGRVGRDTPAEVRAWLRDFLED